MMAEWIDAAVLIAMDDGEIWTGYMEGEQWHYVSSEPITSARITHWMDFPAPPQEGTPPARIAQLERFVRSLLDPEQYGFSVPKEVQDAAREVLK